MRVSDEIKARISTRAFCESVGLMPDRHGDMLCPFHGDTNKSLRVYKNPEKGWACFGCHRGGTVIDFAMQWYGITYRQAVVRLDNDFGLGLPIGRKRTPEERSQMRREAHEIESRKREAQEALYAAESSFLAVSTCLCEVLSTAEKERPKRPSDAVTQAYADALWMLPVLREELQRAQYDLDLARKEVNAIGNTAEAGTSARPMDERRLPVHCAV